MFAESAQLGADAFDVGIDGAGVAVIVDAPDGV